MNEKAKFAVEILKEYANENSTLPRSTSDLSPLEQWLILRLFAVSVAKRKLCPTCGSDSLITLSGVTYCMNDCCDGVKGHN